MSLLGHEPFNDQDAFGHAFSVGLESILEQGSLGAFILSCANAYGQASLHHVLSAKLELHYRDLLEALDGGQAVPGSDEDRTVFAELSEIGLDHLPLAESRPCGPWQLQYNAMRAFRPMRHAAAAPESLQQPFNVDGFHFNKPFMLKEQFWEGRAGRHGLSAYYNKFPFADYHLLWVPDREAELPQYLLQPYHELMWRLCDDLGSRINGFALGYNALGAFASVNHFHFQSYIGEPVPIVSDRWQHNGGNEAYPLSCFRFDSPDEAWCLIQELHSGSQPYNLLYTKGMMYCIPRQYQGRYPQPSWSPGFAWREICGDMVTVRRRDYEELTDDVIAAALATAAVTI
ncbi:MAG: hypothetical protein HUJ29_06550 [Gammaproteobacteria bacterium]|nr:hypothetical protein [Gammaproteobacteria bacterium]